MSRIAIFIDGAYLDYVLKEEFSLAAIDFLRLAQWMAGGIDILRTYYYHCLPYQGNPPTKDESERFGKKQAFFKALSRLPRFEVRLGKLQFRGTRDDGSRIFEQKRVDILLGVDMAMLAGKRQITHVALLAGDSDFLPAVQAAKTEGVLVHLFHGAKPHTDLWEICDERTQIMQTDIDPIRRQ